MQQIIGYLTINCVVAPPGFTMVGESETVRVPVLERSAKNAIKLGVVGKEEWIRPGDFRRLQDACRCVTPETLPTLLMIMSEALEESSSALVPVSRAGKGPTEKSGKFRLEVYTRDYDGIQVEGRPVPLRKIDRTFTLALSQIELLDGKPHAPVWLLKRHLGREESVRGIWPGVDEVRKQLQAAFARLQARVDVKAAEWEAGAPARAAEKVRWDQVYEERKVRYAAEEAEREERRRRLAAKPRHPDRVEENCTVTYPQFSTSGRAIRRVGIVTLNACRVLYFGKKREIIPPEGQTIVKLDSPNLIITPSRQSDESMASQGPQGS